MTKLKHYSELDGVRAIAALMVMVYHFFLTINPSTELISIIKKLSVFGQTGVSLFFVLSGFLITRILLNSKEKPSYFINFFVRRSLRIFPLYFFFLFLYFFLIPYFQNQSIVPFNEQFWYWIYLQNFAMTFNWHFSGPNHFWSLAVEEHFYLFWPFIIYFFDIKKIKIAILALVLLAFLTRIVLLHNGYGVFYFTFARVDELVIGAFLSILELNGKLTAAYTKKYLMLFLVVMIPTISLWIFTTGLGLDYIQIFKFLLLALSYFSFIGFVITLKDHNWFKKILQIKPLSYTGKISYGLYVYHPLSFELSNRYFFTNSIVLSIILGFICSYIISSISFYLFESKFLVLKKKFV